MSIYLNKEVNSHERLQALHVKHCMTNGTEFIIESQNHRIITVGKDL